MYEVLALAIGSGLGYRLRHAATGHAVAITAAAAVVVGLLVSGLSGELEVSVGFVVFDTGQVFVAALAVRALARALERRRAATT